MTGELAKVFRLIAGAFGRLGILYAVGGSIASSARGIARATQDIDLIAHIVPIQAELLSRELGSD